MTCLFKFLNINNSLFDLKKGGNDLMTINRDEHIPDISSQASARAFLRTVFSGDAAKSLSLEHATQYVPWLKGYFEALKKFKEDHSVQYIQVLLEEIYRQGLMEPDRIDSLADRLDNHEGVKLFIAHANSVAEKSFSKKSKAMLALYSGQIVAKPELLERPESAIILDALSAINDFDLKYFNMFKKHIKEINETQTRIESAYQTNISNDNISEQDVKDDLNSFFSSIKKLISLQIISQVTGTYKSLESFLIEESPYTNSFYQLYTEYHELYEKL